MQEEIEKYKSQKFRYFSKFDQGIKIQSKENWFSVTPEVIAEHIAQKLACDIVVDGFCGVGSNAIQLALTCSSVIAIDIVPENIEQARHNARIYGVENKITFITGDFFKVLPCIPRIDGIFLSPPWGGPEYINSQSYGLDAILPVDGWDLMQFCRTKTHNIAFYLPRNTDIHQIVELRQDGEPIEIEQNFINDKLKTLTVYFGEFVSSKRTIHESLSSRLI